MRGVCLVLSIFLGAPNATTALSAYCCLAGPCELSNRRPLKSERRRRGREDGALSADGTLSSGPTGPLHCTGGACACVAITETVRGCAPVAPLPPEVNDCTKIMVPRDGNCCESSQSGNGRCFRVSYRMGECAQDPGSGNDQTQCLADLCSSDADCPAGGVCAPPGIAQLSDGLALPVRGCISAACHTDADCTAGSDGHCWLARLWSPCSCTGGLSVDHPTRGHFEEVSPQLVCVYSDGCTRDLDCGLAGRCILRGGRTVCTTACQ
jgi:hypothetical protein